ncbi:MAG: hypothetical protein ACLU99_06030 [Alphaproteobacteria bacterium]
MTRKEQARRGYRRPCDDAATKQSEVSLLTGTIKRTSLAEVFLWRNQQRLL